MHLTGSPTRSEQWGDRKLRPGETLFPRALARLCGCENCSADVSRSCSRREGPAPCTSTLSAHQAQCLHVGPERAQVQPTEEAVACHPISWPWFLVYRSQFVAVSPPCCGCELAQTADVSGCLGHWAQYYPTAGVAREAQWRRLQGANWPRGD